MTTAATDRPSYPKRPAFFAHKAVRLMMKVVVCQDIGATSFALLVAVAMTEDAAHYRRAVTFYDCQLMMILGLSKNALSRARQRAIEAGWLHYESGRKGVAGRYWITVPATAIGIDDLPSDEGDGDDFQVQNETANGQMQVQNGRESDTESGMKAGRIRDESGTNVGSFHPVPKPIPNPKETPLPPKGENAAIEAEFVNLWNTCQGVRKVRGDSLTAKRRRSFQTRISDQSWDWRAALAKFPLKLTVSDPEGWLPTIDWFLRPDTTQRILEGDYDWSKHGAGASRGHIPGPGQKYDPSRVRGNPEDYDTSDISRPSNINTF